MDKLVERLVNAVQNSPGGIAMLETLESLKLCDGFTLKTTLSRLSKSGKLIRLKRGVYSTNPIRDAFAAAQRTYNGYIGFSSALYIHGLIAELPFAVTIVTVNKSTSKVFGMYEFRSVALKEKAIGFEDINGLTVSTKAKTLFDCIYLEKYSVERDKLINAYRVARLNREELKEFESYVNRFIKAKRRSIFDKIKKTIIGKGGFYGT